MTELDVLLEMWDYDLWANSRWIEPARYAGLSLVLGHILWAQEMWLARCAGTGVRPVENPDPSAEQLTRSMDAWKDFLGESPLDLMVTYANTSGMVFTQPLYQIVRHVLNHGTYHRGDMRGRCEMLGKTFPETDLVGFHRD